VEKPEWERFKDHQQSSDRPTLLEKALIRRTSLHFHKFRESLECNDKMKNLSGKPGFIQNNLAGYKFFKWNKLSFQSAF